MLAAPPNDPNLVRISIGAHPHTQTAAICSHPCSGSLCRCSAFPRHFTPNYPVHDTPPRRFHQLSRTHTPIQKTRMIHHNPASSTIRAMRGHLTTTQWLWHQSPALSRFQEGLRRVHAPTYFQHRPMTPTLSASQSVRIHTPKLPQYVRTPVRDPSAAVRPFPLFFWPNYPVHDTPPRRFHQLSRTPLRFQTTFLRENDCVPSVTFVVFQRTPGQPMPRPRQKPVQKAYNLINCPSR
jgi:hypothetical protein